MSGEEKKITHGWPVRHPRDITIADKLINIPNDDIQNTLPVDYN